MSQERKTHLIAGLLNIINAAMMLILCFMKYKEFGVAILIYFTSLSNVLGGVFSLFIGITELFGKKSRTALVLKQVGTAALTLTLMTVMLYLGPRFGYRRNLTGTEFFLHLLCPIIAILTYLLLDPVNKKELNIFENLYGLIPMALYAVFYYTQVFISKRMPDIYAFSRGGQLASNAIFMSIISIAICILIWVLRRLISTVREK